MTENNDPSVTPQAPDGAERPHAGRVIAVVTAGLVFLALSLVGPFTGTANDRYAELQIRMRFFLGFALLGPPLLAAFLDHEPKLRRWAGYVLAAAIALFTPIDPGTLIACVILAVAASYAIPALREKVAARARPLAHSVSCVFRSVTTRVMASVQALLSCGSSRMPASPSTSGIDAAREAMTGRPHAIASTIGRPNPSYREG